MIYTPNNRSNYFYRRFFDNSYNHILNNELVNEINNVDNNNRHNNIRMLFQILNNMNANNNANIENVLINSFNEKPVYKKVLSEEGKNQLKIIKFNKSNHDIDKCPITRNTFKENEEIIELPCKHIFDKDSITKWLTGSNNQCPICRFELKYKSIKDEVNESSDIDEEMGYIEEDIDIEEISDVEEINDTDISIPYVNNNNMYDDISIQRILLETYNNNVD